MGEKGKKISIVANVQTLEGYYNFDEILEVTLTFNFFNYM